MSWSDECVGGKVKVVGVGGRDGGVEGHPERGVWRCFILFSGCDPRTANGACGVDRAFADAHGRERVWMWVTKRAL